MLVVVRAFSPHDAIGRGQAGPGVGRLLESALGRHVAGRRSTGLELRAGDLEQPVARRLQAGVEEERADDRLEGGGQDRGSLALVGAIGAGAQQERRTEVDAAGEGRQAGRRDDGRAPLRQAAFILVGMAGEEGAGDDQRDDRVTEELETLVGERRGVRVLVGVAAVDQRLTEQVKVLDREREALRESRGLAGRGRFATAQRARRCIRRRRRRCGSSPRPRRRSRSRTPPRGS